MNEPTPTKPRRKLTNLELSAPARGALSRIKRLQGWSFTRSVEIGLKLVEKCLVTADPLDDADRAGLNLKPLATIPANRRKGGAR